MQYLERIGVLGPDVVAAHCIFVDEADRKILAQHNVGCVHNPSSNMMLASGVAPVPEMRAAGIAVGLGTDGPAGSNNDLDLMEEIDLAAKLAKITKMSPLALNALAVVEMATIDGARALHMEKEIGSLEKGKKADVIVISLDEPNAVPMFDVYAQIAYTLKASDVETVMIGGRVVMRDHKLLTVDEGQRSPRRVSTRSRLPRRSEWSEVTLPLSAHRKGRGRGQPFATLHLAVSFSWRQGKGCKSSGTTESGMQSRDFIFWEVDVQADFMLQGGKLYVPGAERILPNIRKLTNAARRGEVFLVSHGCFHSAFDCRQKRSSPSCRS